jgi:hypothetical protein
MAWTRKKLLNRLADTPEDVQAMASGRSSPAARHLGQLKARNAGPTTWRPTGAPCEPIQRFVCVPHDQGHAL